MISSRPSMCCVLTICLFMMVSTIVKGDELIRSRLEAINQGFSIELGGTPLVMQKHLNGFYGSRDYKLVWLTEDGDLRPAAWVLLEAIRNVRTHGLTPSDYHLASIEAHVKDTSETGAGGLAVRDLDMLLSDAFLLLGTHLQTGKTDPGVIDPNWEGVALPQGWLLEQTAQLPQPLTSEGLSHFLADRLPRDPGYARLQSARQKLVELSQAGNWVAIDNGPLLRPGGQDVRVPMIRQRLLQWADIFGTAIDYPDENAATDLYAGPVSEAVMVFQRHHGLEADGIIGAQTIAALNVSPQERVDLIDVNLERWRWMPRELGQRHVLVNIAGFEMQLVEQGEPTLTKRVVVGRDYRRTPVFSDRIRYLVLNPDWVVPPKLAVQDKLPEIQRNPDYLQRLGYRVYNGWGSTREVIDPASVNWNNVTKNSFPYRLVQEPGPMNALGQVKFMFPNQHNVYLHDTPSRELFSKSERAFSSGCVRVQDPLELASLLLQREGWSEERLDSVIAGGRTQTVNLKEPVPVHIQYWTTWVDGEGQIQFRKDIYQRDEVIRKALKENRTS